MSVVVFDFDGTLADSFSVVLRLYNELAAKRGLKQVTLEDWEQIRRMTIPKAMNYVGLKAYHLPWLMRVGRPMLIKRADQINLFKNIDKVIHKLVEHRFKLFILSTNSEKVVHKVLERAGVHENIEILKSPPVFGKAMALKKLIRQKNLDSKRMWMVGDELRDINGARRAGVKSMAVAWGLQPLDVLAKANPNHAVHKPGDITKYFLGQKG